MKYIKILKFKLLKINFLLLMSYSYEPSDNINNKYYQVFDKQPHSRKGKIMNKHKHDQAYSNYKIDIYKKFY